MINFWIAVAISLLAAVVYIWQSVTSELDTNDENSLSKDHSKGKTRAAMVVLIIALLFAPIGYYGLGNWEKQQHWHAAQQALSQVKAGGQFTSDKNKIQDLVLSLRTAVDQDPENGQLWFMLAEIYFQLQMTDLADAALTRALRIEMRPDWLVANAQVVTARGEEADLARAEYLLSQAVQIQPDHQSALLTLGFVQLRQQKFNLAIMNWEKLKQQLAKSGNDVSRIQKQIDFAKREWVKKSQQ